MAAPFRQSAYFPDMTIAAAKKKHANNKNNDGNNNDNNNNNNKQQQQKQQQPRQQQQQQQQQQQPQQQEQQQLQKHRLYFILLDSSISISCTPDSWILCPPKGALPCQVLGGYDAVAPSPTLQSRAISGLRGLWLAALAAMHHAMRSCKFDPLSSESACRAFQRRDLIVALMLLLSWNRGFYFLLF